MLLKTLKPSLTIDTTAQRLSKALVNCLVMMVREKVRAGELGNGVGGNVPIITEPYHESIEQPWQQLLRSHT